VRNLATYQDEYEALPFEDVQSRFRKRKIGESLERYQPRALLEIGCGLDPIFNHYSGFEHCTVVEPAQRFVAAARRQASDRPEISVIASTLEDAYQTVSVRHYDFILASSLLHEIEEPGPILDIVRSLCNTSTIVHINVPNALSFHRLLAVAMGITPSAYARSATQMRMQQYQTFDTATLANLASRHGFSVVDKGTFFIKPFTHAQMAHLQASGLMTEQMLVGLYTLSEQFPEHGSEIWMNLRPSAPT